MATKSEEIVWRGIPIRVETDMGTGQAKVYLRTGNSFEDDVPVMESDRNKASKWDYTASGLDKLKRAFNDANPNGTIQPGENFSRQVVWANGIQTFNAARATTLNDADNFTGTPDEIKKRQEDLVQQSNVPGVIDPVTKQTVSTNGTVIAGAGSPPPEEQQTEEEQPSTTSSANPVYEAAETKASPEVGKKNLRYPLGSPPAGFPFDFIRISAFTYKPSGLDYINNSLDVNNNVRTSFERIGSEVSSVTLPMQPNLSESHSVGWGGDALDPIRAALASASMGVMNSITDLNGQAFLNAAGGAISDLSSMITDDQTRGFIQAYFAGQAVGANITGRTTGQVINPNMELLFNGPTLRTFNFNFRMTPRSEPEADEIKKIIRSFKVNMAVQRSESNLFLSTPNIFLLRYVASDSSGALAEHPFLNKFKPCAMTGFNVNYTPDGSYMTYDNKSLTAYDMSLSFSELEPIYQDDYTENYSSHATMGF